MRKTHRIGGGRSLAALALAFRRDRKGAAAILFALTFVAATAAALLAMDLTRATTVRGALQDALDAATIAAAVSRATDASEIDQIGDKFLAAQFNEGGVTSVNATFTPTDTAIVADATADLSPFFASLIMNKATIPVKAHSEVLRDYDSAVTELVLVLDTTDSMAGTKMTALKTSATELVNKVTASPSNKIRIGIIPFGQYVNIGVSRRKQPWVKVDDDWSQTTPAKPAETKTVTNPAKCVDVKKTTCTVPAKKVACTKYKDGVPYDTTCNQPASGCTTVVTGQTCTPATTTTTTIPATPAKTVHHVFNGCVGSPAYPMNVRDSDPPPKRRYPGFLDITCGTEITPLTPSKTQVTKAIDALTTSGDTYIPAGLAWGFNALSSGDPLTEAAAYDASKKNTKPRKVLVLMTDGLNTMYMKTADGSHAPLAQPAVATQANGYTAELCANIKAEKIEVFTIAFQVSDTITKTMLDNCASDKDHYFDAANSAALSAAFQKIADSLQVVRIAK